jgi:hypothetical protein
MRITPLLVLLACIMATEAHDVSAGVIGNLL